MSTANEDIQNSLNALLRAVKDLPNRTLKQLALDASMTDTDLMRLIDDSRTLAEDIQTEIEDDLLSTVETVMSTQDIDWQHQLFDTVAENLISLDRDSITNAIHAADRSHDLICLELFKFNDLSAPAQRRAIQDYKLKWRKENPGESLTSDETREELSRGGRESDKYLYNGMLIDHEDLGL